MATTDQANVNAFNNMTKSLGSGLIVGQSGAPTSYKAPAINPTTNPTTTNTTNPAVAPVPTPTGPKAPVPVVTSQSAQDDYNKKYAAYQDAIKNIQAQTDRIAQDKAVKDSLKAQNDLHESAVNLQQQGIDIKKAEVEAKNKALSMASDNGSTPTTNNPTPTPTGTNNAPQSGATAGADTTNPVTTSTNNINNADTANNDAQQQIIDQKTQVFNVFQSKVSQLMNGTFPLSTTEQALINSVQQSLDRQKASVTGVLTEEMARSGQEYTPGQAAGMIANKVMDLDAQAAGTMAQLKLGFEKQDYAMINDTYEKQTKYLDDKSAQIQKLHDTVVATEKDIRAQAQKVQDGINSIATDAAKNGATPEQLAKIGASKTVGEAIANAGDTLQSATGTLGDYLQYKKDTLAKGLTPKDYTTFKNDEANKQDQRDIAKTVATEKAKADAQNAATSGDKNQQKLEQQYRGVLSKEFSSRTGSLGIENGKVNQANHLNSLITQYYDPKTGEYNIPQSQTSELIMGLANLISPTGVVSDSARDAITQKTAKGDFNGAIAYVTGTPQNGTTQDVIKNLIDSVDRQAETATRNREAALQNMRDQAPTDLDPSRVEALNKSTEMVKYEGQDRIDSKPVEDFVSSPEAKSAIDPSINQKVSSLTGGKTFSTNGEFVMYMSQLPGATPTGVLNTLKGLGIIK